MSSALLSQKVSPSLGPCCPRHSAAPRLGAPSLHICLVGWLVVSGTYGVLEQIHHLQLSPTPTNTCPSSTTYRPLKPKQTALPSRGPACGTTFPVLPFHLPQCLCFPGQDDSCAQHPHPASPSLCIPSATAQAGQLLLLSLRGPQCPCFWSHFSPVYV